MADRDRDCCFRSRDPETTGEAGRLLGRLLVERGLLVALGGPLGAGKSVFVRGIAEGLGIDPAVISSPTFTIVNQYPVRGGRQLSHVDFYRLQSEMEVEDVGFQDLLEPGDVVAVEWAHRFEGLLPAERLEVRLERGQGEDDSSLREIEVRALGAEPRAILESWRKALEALPALELE